VITARQPIDGDGRCFNQSVTTSPNSTRRILRRPAHLAARLVVMATVGVGVGVLCALTFSLEYAPLSGWIAAACTYCLWVWLTVSRMDANRTARHATVEDPSRGLSELLILAGSLFSLAGVVWVLIRTGESASSLRIAAAALALGSVALSWWLVHTLFTLRYAHLYYRGTVGGVDFNQSEPPQYTDFAYLAFTIGMTFQVSDTNLTSLEVRKTALHHGLLSYLFGSVILATLVNLIAGITGGH